MTVCLNYFGIPGYHASTWKGLRRTLRMKKVWSSVVFGEERWLTVLTYLLRDLLTEECAARLILLKLKKSSRKQSTRIRLQNYKTMTKVSVSRRLQMGKIKAISIKFNHENLWVLSWPTEIFFQFPIFILNQTEAMAITRHIKQTLVAKRDCS